MSGTYVPDYCPYSSNFIKTNPTTKQTDKQSENSTPTKLMAVVMRFPGGAEA